MAALKADDDEKGLIRIFLDFKLHKSRETLETCSRKFETPYSIYRKAESNNISFSIGSSDNIVELNVCYCL